MYINLLNFHDSLLKYFYSNPWHGYCYYFIIISIDEKRKHPLDIQPFAGPTGFKVRQGKFESSDFNDHSILAIKIKLHINMSLNFSLITSLSKQTNVKLNYTAYGRGKE